jgi:hypothetical protein
MACSRATNETPPEAIDVMISNMAQTLTKISSPLN